MSALSENQNINFNSSNLIVFFYRWRKTLLIGCFSAAVISAVASLLIREKFKSTVILFPATTHSISKALIADNRGEKRDVLAFGEEEEAEQLLQILQSDVIRQKIISKYDLMNHYRISPDEKYKITKLNKEYENNITCKRTEFMSVKIEVLDYDKDTAALMANDIAAYLDTMKNNMQQEVAKEALKIVEQEYYEREENLKMLTDSLKKLMLLGVQDYESQSEVLNQQLAVAIIQGNQNAVRKLEEKLEVMSKYGGAYMSIRDKMEWDIEHFSLLKTKYNEAKVDAQNFLPAKFIVNKAYPAEKKSYPIRWLIVVMATLGTFILSIFSILIFENIRQIRLEEGK